MPVDEETIEDLEQRLDTIAELAAAALSELDEYSPTPASDNLKELKNKLVEIRELSAAEDDDDEGDDEEDEGDEDDD